MTSRPFLAFVFFWAITPAYADALRIGASSSVYRDLARQIGGASVVSETPASAAPHGEPDVSRYALVISDGSAHDAAFRAAARRAARPIIVLESTPAAAGSAAKRYPWFDTRTMGRFAHTVAAAIARIDPGQAAVFDRNAAHYEASLDAIRDRMKDLARSYAKTDVVLAHDFYSGVISELGFTIENRAYIDADSRHAPEPQTLTALLRAIQGRKASILIYDRDAAGAATKQLIAMASDAGMPVVGLNERLPSGLTYQQWMIRQINTLRGALNEAAP